MYTESYMNCFLDKMNTDNFDEEMSNMFEKIYWNCPNLLTHLKLNVRYLVSKYRKNLTNFCKIKIDNLYKQSETTNSNYLKTYESYKKLLKLEIDSDQYTNITKFVNKQLNIDEYLINSPVRDKKINQRQ